MCLVKVALMVEGQEGVTWPQWVALAQAAEAAGLDALFRSDHYQSNGRDPNSGSLDAWTTLAGLAAVTERIRLGTLVSPVTFRPVSVLAKSATTVDHISGGRVELGIGAGWYEREHATYGFPFGTAKTRVDELERQLADIHRQWLEDADVQPKPVQQPRPPIIVGGSGKPRTVAAALRWADEYNTFFPSVEEARERRRLVEPLRFSVMLPLRARGAELAEQLAAYEDAGVDRVMLQLQDHTDLGAVAELAGVR